VTDIIKAGFLFIWLEKEWIQKVVSITAKWGFKYVENFCWIKKDINNQIHKSQYKYFNKSKLSLLIFRKEGDIELRHQRNPDCVFDFIRPKLPGKNILFFFNKTYSQSKLDEVSEKKPPFMYSVIETLLPTANYHPEKNPRGEKLIEL
jgi:N6-adenosine-specific RNA methylase IME4